MTQGELALLSVSAGFRYSITSAASVASVAISDYCHDYQNYFESFASITYDYKSR